MPCRGVLLVVVLAIVTAGSRTPLQCAQASGDSRTVVVAGDVPNPLTVSASELKGMPRTTVNIGEPGRQVRYDGVLIGELMKRAGLKLGHDLSGKALSTYVRASARDGYVVVFSLAELDPESTSNDILIADTVDGQRLPDAQGPLRIVTPHDKHGSRSVRMLQRLDVVQLVK